MMKLTILTSEEMSELQELVDGVTQYIYVDKNPDWYIIPKDMFKRIATILGLDTPNELTTPRRNNGVSKDKEIDNDKE